MMVCNFTSFFHTSFYGYRKHTKRNIGEVYSSVFLTTKNITQTPVENVQMVRLSPLNTSSHFLRVTNIDGPVAA